MNEHLLIFAGLVLLIIIAIVFWFRKEKFTPSATGNGTLVGDASGNLSYVASLPLYSIIPWLPLQTDGSFVSNINNITAPNGWVICDGRPISPGSPVKTPDLTQRYLRGGDNIGFMGGNTSSQVTLQNLNLPPHYHTSNVPVAQYDGNLPAVDEGMYYIAGGVAYAYGGFSKIAPYGSIINGNQDNNATNAAIPFNIEPQYFTVYYIMKIA